MDGNVLPSKLLTVLSKATDIVRSHGFIQVYTHYDADGLSSAGIIANTLLRAGKEFQITTFKTLDAENLDIILNCNSDCVLIADLGASYIKELDMSDKEVIVLDHHTIRDEATRIAYANPHLYGVDGMTGACGATMSFLFSITMDERNWDLVQIAFGGIVGDKQHLNGLTGFNTYLLDEGVKRGFIKVMQGSMIPSGPLVESLTSCTEPYIRGITGERENVLKMLKDANIPEESSFITLTEDEKRRLSSMIAVKLTGQNVRSEVMRELTKTRYHLMDWSMDAESFTELMDACGRKLYQGLGISLCLKDRDALVEAIALKDEYNKEILESTLELDRNGLIQRDHIQYFDSSESGYSGVLAGIAMRYFADPDKPTIAMNSSEKKVKVSSRGTLRLLDKGLDLSTAMFESCKAVGGEGGGHKVASGGSFDQGKEEEFIDILDKIVGEQFSLSK